jgi:hypothetical protein
MEAKIGLPELAIARRFADPGLAQFLFKVGVSGYPGRIDIAAIAG